MYHVLGCVIHIVVCKGLQHPGKYIEDFEDYSSLVVEPFVNQINEPT